MPIHKTLGRFMPGKQERVFANIENCLNWVLFAISEIIRLSLLVFILPIKARVMCILTGFTQDDGVFISWRRLSDTDEIFSRARSDMLNAINTRFFIFLL